MICSFLLQEDALHLSSIRSVFVWRQRLVVVIPHLAIAHLLVIDQLVPCAKLEGHARITGVWRGFWRAQLQGQRGPQAPHWGPHIVLAAEAADCG